jgi:hypothetical protein
MYVVIMLHLLCTRAPGSGVPLQLALEHLLTIAVQTSDPSPLDAIREQTSKIEDWLDTISEPLKPYVEFRIAYMPIAIGEAAASTGDVAASVD